MHFLPVAHVSPELILLIFLPALLFEAAWNLKLDHLRENWLPIMTLAIVGVVISVGVIGAILHWGTGLAWPSAMLFGAMISATDPVSVLALFKKLGAPKRLTTIVESESLFNDGTAVVVFRIILGVVMGTTAGTASGLALHSLREFCLVVFGGLAVGATIGIIASVLTSYFDDHLLEITLTTIVAYGSFLLAEGLHVSPVIGVLVACLIVGNYGRNRGMIADSLYQKLRTDLDRTQRELNEPLAALDVDNRAAEQQYRLQRHLINEKKARLALLLREGLLSEEEYQELNVKLDEDLARLQEEAVTA